MRFVRRGLQVRLKTPTCTNVRTHVHTHAGTTHGFADTKRNALKKTNRRSNDPSTRTRLRAWCAIYAATSAEPRTGSSNTAGRARVVRSSLAGRLNLARRLPLQRMSSTLARTTTRRRGLLQCGRRPATLANASEIRFACADCDTEGVGDTAAYRRMVDRLALPHRARLGPHRVRLR